MYLEQIRACHFRNIEHLELPAHARFNVLFGDNAQGKTNLLEAIHLLGSLKSFRGARNEELIRRGCDQARLSASVRQKNGVEQNLQLDIDRDGKTVRLNGKGLQQPDDYLNCLRPIVFAPEEVGLVKGGPHGRRRLVDRAVFMTTPGYLGELQQYERTLKQRNRLLKENRSQAELEPWTVSLVRLGARIRKARAEYIDAIAPAFSDCHAQICQGRESAEVRSRPGMAEIADLENDLNEELAQRAEQERRYGVTLGGPHRDDIQFLLDGRSLRTYGSQGQQRSFILALKTAQALDLEQRHGEPPLLLLDDLLGELDGQRQEFFFTFLRQRRGQVFITATDAAPLRQGGLTEGHYYRVEGGTVQPVD